MFPPILCGADFSENALQVSSAAARLGAKVTLAHSLDERGKIPAHYCPQSHDCLGARLIAEAAVTVVCVPKTQPDAG